MPARLIRQNGPAAQLTARLLSRTPGLASYTHYFPFLVAALDILLNDKVALQDIQTESHRCMR